MPPKWPFQDSYHPPHLRPLSPFTTVTFYSRLPHRETFLSKHTPQQEAAAPPWQNSPRVGSPCAPSSSSPSSSFLHHFLGAVREPQASSREKSKQHPASSFSFPQSCVEKWTETLKVCAQRELVCLERNFGL